MISLNLLPDVKLEYLQTQRTKAKVISVAVMVTAIAIGLVILVSGWVYGAQTLQKGYLTGEIKKHDKELKELPDINKYLTLQNQLAHITQLHEGKSDFSRLMGYLPQLTPAGTQTVSLTSIELKSGDETGNTLVFQGEAKDYTALNTFRDTLMNAKLSYLQEDEKQSEKLFETVAVTSSSLESGLNGARVVTFTVDTTYNVNAFLASIKKPEVSVPSITTTQSAQGAPAVFSQSTVQRGAQ